MTFYISGKPTFHLKDILAQRKRQSNIFPLDQERCFFFFSARYALVAAIKALGLKPGNQVLIPAYNCGVEIDPFLYLNIEPVFYKVKKDLNVDLDDLIEKCNCNAKAVLVTHFLGFSQPIDEIKTICKDKGLFLIEDCAHALLSDHQGRPLGSYGDAAVFSFLKTFPVPNGGLLVLNTIKPRNTEEKKSPNVFSTFLFLLELYCNRTWQTDSAVKEDVFKILKKCIYLTASGLKLLISAFRKALYPTAHCLVRADSFSFEEKLLIWQPSKISMNIINHYDFYKVKTLRRQNFQYLLKHFQKNEKCILPLKNLPPGICPLFFPILLKNETYRAELYGALKAKGIITHPWWDRFHRSVPWHDFADAVCLKKRLLGFPIHQDISINYLDILISEFEKQYRNMEN